MTMLIWSGKIQLGLSVCLQNITRSLQLKICRVVCQVVCLINKAGYQKCVSYTTNRIFGRVWETKACRLRFLNCKILQFCSANAVFDSD